MVRHILIKQIKTLYTSHMTPPVKGEDMSHIQSLDDAYLVIRDGVIDEIGQHFQGSSDRFDMVYDASGLIALPGLIDAHTHLVYGGSREDEFRQKLAGVPYLDILKQGGGILNTVLKTKAASFDDLYQKARQSLDRMLCYGVTAIEAKSGYGLEWETERKQLLVLKKLNETHPIDIHITYLGAHALPKAFAHDRNGFIRQVIKDLEKVKSEGLAEAVDVFCEAGVFDAAETKEILKAAASLGFNIHLHTDEIESIGGVDVALEFGSDSVDHLMALKEADMEHLAHSNTIGHLLPATSFFLNKDYAPARKMIEKGMALALCSDYNPGSTPSENFQFTLQLAANKLRMLPEEVLTAATINPAFSLGIHRHVGSLAVGKDADIVLMDAKNWDYALYHYAINHTKAVFKKGQLVVEDQRRVKEIL